MSSENILKLRSARLSSWLRLEELQMSIPYESLETSTLFKGRGNLLSAKLVIEESSFLETIKQISVSPFSNVDLWFENDSIGLCAKVSFLEATGYIFATFGVVIGRMNSIGFDANLSSVASFAYHDLIRVLPLSCYIIGHLPVTGPELIHSLFQAWRSAEELQPFLPAHLPVVESDTIFIDIASLLVARIAVPEGWKLPGRERVKITNFSIVPGFISINLSEKSSAKTSFRANSAEQKRLKAMLHVREGDKALFAKKYHRAVAQYAIQQKEHPSVFNLERWLDTIFRLIEPKEMKRAAQVISKTLRVNPANPIALTGALRLASLNANDDAIIAITQQLCRYFDSINAHRAAVLTLVYAAEELYLTSPNKATQVITDALERMPSHPSVLRVSALIARNNGDYEILEKALIASIPSSKNATDRAAICVELAQLRALAKDREGESNYLVQAIHFDPNNAQITRKIADVLITENSFDEATAYYLKAAELLGEVSPTEAADNLVAAARVREKGGKREKARHHLMHALTLDSNHAEARLMQLQLAAEEDPKQFKELQQIVIPLLENRSYQTNATADHERLATAKTLFPSSKSSSFQPFIQEKPSQDLEELKESIAVARLKKDNTLLAKLLEQRAKAENNKKASARCFFEAGLILYHELEDAERAKECLESARKVDPQTFDKDREILSTLEGIYEDLDDPAALVSIFEAKIEIESSDEMRAVLEVLTARLYAERLNNFSSALMLLNGLLQKNPQHQAAQEEKAKILLIMNKPELALHLYHQLLEHPDLAVLERQKFLHKMVFITDELLGDDSLSMNYLQAILDGSPRDPRALEKLQTVYLRTKNWMPLLGLLEQRILALIDEKNLPLWLTIATEENALILALLKRETTEDRDLVLRLLSLAAYVFAEVNANQQALAVLDYFEHIEEPEPDLLEQIASISTKCGDNERAAKALMTLSEMMLDPEKAEELRAKADKLYDLLEDPSEKEDWSEEITSDFKTSKDRER